MSERIVKTIDGDEYSFEKFGAKKSLKILVRLSKMIGKPISLLVGSIKSEKGTKVLDSEIKTDVLALAIEAMADNLDSDEVISLMEELAANSILCNDKIVKFDSHYEGKLPHLFKVLAAALEVQYGNFFDAFKGFQESRKPSTSTQGQAT